MENKTSSTEPGGLTPNVAAALSYALWFITGIIFLLTSKDKFVRFHALQSIITFGALFVLQIVIGLIPGVGMALQPIIWVAGIILWIILIIKAYQGEKFKLPVAGDIAEKNS